MASKVSQKRCCVCGEPSCLVLALGLQPVDVPGAGCSSSLVNFQKKSFNTTPSFSKNAGSHFSGLDMLPVGASLGSHQHEVGIHVVSPLLRAKKEGGAGNTPPPVHSEVDYRLPFWFTLKNRVVMSKSSGSTTIKMCTRKQTTLML